MKVFISSTVKDLKDYRLCLIKGLQKISLKVVAMELWAASSSTPLNVCLKNVRDSDVFVCLIGHHYGSIDKKTGLSFTELEYKEAIKRKKKCLVFLLNKKSTRSFNINAKKLKRFVANLKKKCFCRQFSSQKELTELVVSSIFGEMEKKSFNLLHLPKFWNKSMKIWEKNYPPDWRIEYNPSHSPLELIFQIQNIHSGLKHYISKLEKSNNNLEADLASLMERVGYDISKIQNEVPYYENPFVSRDWEEWNIYMTNLMNVLKIRLAQLKMKYLEMKSEQLDFSYKEIKELEKAKRELKQVLMGATYID